MRKKSPKLIIASVNGNFGLFTVISLSALWFTAIERKQIDCYFNDDSWHPSTFESGDKCMAAVCSSRKTYIHLEFALSILSVTYFEYCAIIPYVLRSLRIKKMFKMREKYLKTQKIPRKNIQQWNEKRVLAILMISCLTYSSITIFLILYYDRY